MRTTHIHKQCVTNPKDDNKKATTTTIDNSPRAAMCRQLKLNLVNWHNSRQSRVQHISAHKHTHTHIHSQTLTLIHRYRSTDTNAVYNFHANCHKSRKWNTYLSAARSNWLQLRFWLWLWLWLCLLLLLWLWLCPFDFILFLYLNCCYSSTCLQFLVLSPQSLYSPHV